MTTLKEYKHQREFLRRAHNDSWNRAYQREWDGTCQECGHAAQKQFEANEERAKEEHGLFVKRNDKKVAELGEELKTSEFAWRVCDKTITFQAPAGYGNDDWGCNHTLGSDLQKQFPQGINDSESGQGFFYINTRYAEAVLAWLNEKNVNTAGVDDTFGLMVQWDEEVTK